MPNNINVPLISQRVSSLLAALCPDEFQLIPAVIQTLDAPITGYCLLNVLAEISGMDHARLRFILIPGLQDIMQVERLHYAAGAIGKHHLAREREYQPFLWASDNLVQRFAQEKIKGCVFEPPESIHP
jgi:hypothetical protein